MLHKSLSLLLLTLVVTSASVILATHYSRGETSFSAGEKRMKVLRRRGHLKLKPTAKEIQEAQPPPEERVFDNTIPKHVPVKIKIKKEKEKAFKDLKNDKWARDFEMELTNTGAKPIYSIYMLLVLPEVRNRSGVKIVFPLFYGRNELGDTKVKALPEDVPIRPGETYVFTISQLQIPVWEQLQREEKRPQPKRIQLKLQVISFGDGTGYIGNDGLAVPHATSQTSGVGACPEPANKSPLGKEALRAALTWQKSSFTGSPASFLPVNFYAHAVSLEPKPAPQSCCTGDGCTTLTSSPFTDVCVNCPPQERPGISNCGDPAAGCYNAVEGSMEWFHQERRTFCMSDVGLDPLSRWASAIADSNFNANADADTHANSKSNTGRLRPCHAPQ